MATQAQIIEGLKADRDLLIDAINGIWISSAFIWGVAAAQRGEILKFAMNKLVALATANFKGEVVPGDCDTFCQFTAIMDTFKMDVVDELRATFGESLKASHAAKKQADEEMIAENARRRRLHLA